MSLTGVPNMKEIDPEEGYFWLKVVVVNRCEEENVKKIGQFSETYILQTAKSILFKCDI